MNAILKDRVKDTKEEINECNHQLQLAQKEVDLKTRFIEQLEAQSGKYAQEKRERLQQTNNDCLLSKMRSQRWMQGS